MRRITGMPVPAGLFLTTCLLITAGCAEEEAATLVDPNYREWSQTVPDTIRGQVPGHGDTLRRIYINDVGTAVVTTEDENGAVDYDYPAGTVIVKEAFNEEPTTNESPDAITAMVKSPGTDEARGGWIWISKDPETGAEDRSLGDFCLTCHESANEEHPYGGRNVNGEFRDFVFYPYRGDS